MVAKTRATGLHRKRQGQHQKRSKHFIRVYAPYIPLLMLVLVNVTIGFSWRQKPAKDVLAYATSISPQALLDSTNVQRANNAAGALTLNTKLNAAAQAKANDMATRDYWSHNTPEGNTPWTFITNAGYSYSKAGENLAYGFTEVDGSLGVTAGWMNSPSHKENLINPAYQEVGFGIANAAVYQGHSQETVVVAMYATPYSVAAKPVAPKPGPVVPAPATQQSTPTPAAGAPAPEPSHEVVVTILDDAGKPSPFIKVTLHSFPQVGYTDKDGVVIFKNVEAGEHTATAETPYGTTEKKVEVATTQAKVEMTITKPLPENQTTSTSTNIPKALPSKKSNRLSGLTHGSLPWLMAAMTVVALVGLCYVLLKHSVKLHKLLIKGEKYVLHHSLLDLTIVNFSILCYLLSRSVGTIL